MPTLNILILTSDMKMAWVSSLSFK